MNIAGKIKNWDRRPKLEEIEGSRLVARHFIFPVRNMYVSRILYIQD